MFVWLVVRVSLAFYVIGSHEENFVDAKDIAKGFNSDVVALVKCDPTYMSLAATGLQDQREQPSGF